MPSHLLSADGQYHAAVEGDEGGRQRVRSVKGGALLQSR